MKTVKCFKSVVTGSQSLLPSNGAAICRSFRLILEKNIDNSISCRFAWSHLYSNLFLLQCFLRWTYDKWVNRFMTESTQ